MQCRICNALKRELRQEGHTEAVATLKQRARMIGLVADHSQEDLENVILVSRKRRAHIATELHMHNVDVHGEEEDQPTGVGKAAPA